MKETYETKILKTSHYSIQLYIDYFNKRLRVDDYRGNINRIVPELHHQMENFKFTKLIFYTRNEHWQGLLSQGFELEGVINGFFNGSDNYIMTHYREADRRTSTSWLQEDAIIQAIYEKGKKTEEAAIPSYYRFRKAAVEDATRLAELYGTVFSIYPTPMNHPEYVAKVMKSGTCFYIVEHEDKDKAESGGKLVSAASAEINQVLHHAELTDCATLPEHRKYGLMKKLLLQLESHLKNSGIYCAFSLARALSYGMNAAFFQLGYQYHGRLTNNCYIFHNKLENMNVWVKDLAAD